MAFNQANITSLMEDILANVHRPPFQPISREVLFAVAIFLTCVALTATIGNGVFIAVLIQCRSMQSDAHMILLLTIAICDLGISIVGYPFTIISNYMGAWIFGDLICKMYAFCCYTLSMIVANTLVVVSIFRYIIVCKPESKHRLTPRLSGYCIVAVIVYALIWTATPFFGWSSYTYEPFYTSCSFDWYDRSVGGITYVFATTIFCYILHLVIMGWCYRKIHVRVANLQLETTMAFAVDSQEPNPGCVTLNACSLVKVNTQRNLKTMKIEMEVLKLNVLMVAAFFIIWTPYAIISLIAPFISNIPKFWFIFPTVFAKTSCLVNPILYGVTNSYLRIEFRKLWRRMTSICRTKAVVAEINSINV